jgi:hypothetical protein
MPRALQPFSLGRKTERWSSVRTAGLGPWLAAAVRGPGLTESLHDGHVEVPLLSQGSPGQGLLCLGLAGGHHGGGTSQPPASRVGLMRRAIYTRQSVVPPEGDPSVGSCQLPREACERFRTNRRRALEALFEQFV